MQQLYLAHYEGSTCYQSPSAALAIPLMQMMPYEIYQMKDYYQCLKLHGIQVTASVIQVNNIVLNSAPSNRYMRISMSTGSSFRSDIFGEQNGQVLLGSALEKPSIIDYQSMCQMPNVHHRDFEFDNMVNGSSISARVAPDSSVTNPKIRSGLLSYNTATAYYDSNMEQTSSVPSNSNVPNSTNSQWRKKATTIAVTGTEQ